MTCPFCQYAAKFHSYQTRRLLTVHGGVRVQRAYYYCGRCRQSFLPYDGGRPGVGLPVRAGDSGRRRRTGRHPLAGGALLAFVGDAMGHGVEAAMLMAVAKTSLHAAARTTPDPSRILGLVNQEPCDLIGDRFMTAVCCRLDPQAGVVDVALAGHMQPLLFDACTGEVSRPGDAGLPLGVRATEEYLGVRCPFGRGDSLLLYTDGVTDAVDGSGRQYGEDRLAELIHRHGRGAADLLGAVEADLRAHSGEADRKDDFTLLVVKSTSHICWPKRAGVSLATSSADVSLPHRTRGPKPRAHASLGRAGHGGSCASTD